MLDTQVNTLQACSSLIIEHRQMETWLNQLHDSLSALTPTADLQAVKDHLAVIVREMNTHFACEEQVLFPAVNPYHTMVLMEAEHEQLIALRESLLKQLESSSLTEAELEHLRTTGYQFISEMFDHIGREDAGIFPACEQSLSEVEKQTVIDGMALIREKAKHEPIPTISRPERSFCAYSADLSGQVTKSILARRLFEDDIWDLKQITIQEGESLAAHWTPKKALIICLAGEAIFHANEQEAPLTPGSIITMTPQLTHAIAAKTTCHLLLLLEKASH